MLTSFAKLFRKCSGRGYPPPLSQRGQSMVELGLVMPVLLWFLLGTLDLGRVYYAYVTVSNSSRVGAEFAMDPRRTQTEVRQIIESEAAPYLTISDSDITFTTASWSAGNQLTVAVQTRFTAITPFISSLWGGGQLTIRGLTTTRFTAT